MSRVRAEREQALAQRTREQAELATARQRVQDALQAQEFLQELAQTLQQQAHQQIARVVSRCLTAVFDSQYELLINFEKARGKTEAVLTFWKDEHEIDPDVDSGGVREVAALALRLASLVLSLPPLQKTLVLDEPFRQVSDSNLPRIAALLKTLSTEMSVQFVLSTHSELLAECLGEFGTIVRL